MPSKSESSTYEGTTSLKELIASYPEAMQKLFVRTLMLHAGHQIGAPKSDREIVALVRKDIEQSL